MRARKPGTYSRFFLKLGDDSRKSDDRCGSLVGLVAFDHAQTRQHGAAALDVAFA
jgi:hypothetical protein